MKKSLLATIVATTVAVTSFSANAALEGTWNAGAGLGLSVINNSNYNKGYKSDDSSVVNYKVYGEYNFKEWFGVGIDYSYFENDDKFYNHTIKWETMTLAPYAKFALPLDQNGTDLFVKLGINYNDWNAKATDGSKYEDHCYSVLVGLGGNYKFNKNIGVRAGFDYNPKAHHYEIAKSAKESIYTFYAAFDYTF